MPEERGAVFHGIVCSAVVQDLGDKRVKLGMGFEGKEMAKVRAKGTPNAGLPEAQIVLMHLSDPEAAFFTAGRRYAFYVYELDEQGDHVQYPAEGEAQEIGAGDVGDAGQVLGGQ